MAGEGTQAGNHRTFHRGLVVAKANGIDEFPGPLVVLGIERVDVADPATHEEKNDRPGFRDVVRTDDSLLDFARLRPESAERQPQESAADLMNEIAASETPTGIN